VGSYFYGVSHTRIPRGWAPASPKFWNPTYAHTVWTRVTKCGIVTHMGEGCVSRDKPTHKGAGLSMSKRTTYAHTVLPRANKFGMVTHTWCGMFPVDLSCLQCHVWNPRIPNFWDPTYAHPVWPRPTKFGMVTCFNGSHAILIPREWSSSTPKFLGPPICATNYGTQ